MRRWRPWGTRPGCKVTCPDPLAGQLRLPAGVQVPAGNVRALSAGPGACAADAPAAGHDATAACASLLAILADLPENGPAAADLASGIADGLPRPAGPTPQTPRPRPGLTQQPAAQDARPEGSRSDRRGGAAVMTVVSVATIAGIRPRTRPPRGGHVQLPTTAPCFPYAILIHCARAGRKPAWQR